MSVPKVKCPSCGTEWMGPVVFCGECGAAIKAPQGAPKAVPLSAPSALAQGERVVRVPPPAPHAPPQAPPAPQVHEAPPPHKPAKVATPTKPIVPDTRRTTMGMPAPREATSGGHGAAEGKPRVSSGSAPPPESVRGGKLGGKRSRKGVVVMPVGLGAHEETDKMLEALDAGFDSITTAPVETPAPAPAEAAAPKHEPKAAPEPKVEPPASAEPKAEPAAPPAPEAPRPSAPPASEPELVFSAVPEIDEATRQAQHEADMAEVRALFTEMAVAHARPLRDFMIEVSWGEPTREWLDVAIPACSALRRAADALEMPELGAALDGFAAALELCQAEVSIHRDAKEMLLGAYAKLTDLMPAAFALEGERGRREPIIVRSLLLQVPGVQKVAIDKIYSAGLVSLEMLYAAGAKELAETTGLAPDVAQRIHERFQAYRKEVAGLDPARDRAAERAELAVAVEQLAVAHAEHERAAAAWGPEAAAIRAHARKERNDLLLRVNVLLARMGEVDRLRALEKVPFAQKIRDLKAFLDEAKRRASRA